MSSLPGNFQRVGAISNAHAGRDFEEHARRFFFRQGVVLQRNFTALVGISNLKKIRRFDLGSDTPPVLVECKSHTWTSGGNNPSAKLTVWNESMYYFYAAPSTFRKIMFVLRGARRDETLARYYLRTFEHLIPTGVEFWEYDLQAQSAVQLRLWLESQFQSFSRRLGATR